MGVVEEGVLYAISNEVDDDYVKTLCLLAILAYTYSFSNWSTYWLSGYCSCWLSAVFDGCASSSSKYKGASSIYKDFISYRAADGDLHTDHTKCTTRWCSP